MYTNVAREASALAQEISRIVSARWNYILPERTKQPWQIQFQNPPAASGLPGLLGANSRHAEGRDRPIRVPEGSSRRPKISIFQPPAPRVVGEDRMLPAIRRADREEARAKPGRLSAAHVRWRSKLGGDCDENLVTRCVNCQGKMHDSHKLKSNVQQNQQLWNAVRSGPSDRYLYASDKSNFTVAHSLSTI